MRKLLLVLCFLVPSSLFAQSIDRDRDRDDRWRERRAPRYDSRSWNMFELTPFVGYRYGGTLWSDRTDLFGFDIDVASNPNLGINFGIPLGDTPMKLELMANQQQTQLTTGSGLFEPDVDVADIDITYYHAGLQIPFGDPGAAVPFVILSAGVANLRPDITGVAAENRFSASAGIGVKVPLSRNIGLRIDARGYFTSLGEVDDDCFRCNDAWGRDLYQGETNIGLVISF